jgi:hypothetical protein
MTNILSPFLRSEDEPRKKAAIRQVVSVSQKTGEKLRSCTTYLYFDEV